MPVITLGRVTIQAPQEPDFPIKSLAKKLNRAVYFKLLSVEFGCSHVLVVLLSAELYASNGADPQQTGTISDRGIFVNVGLVRTERHARKVALHEFFHYVMLKSGISLPLWLNEGLAEYFSGESLSCIGGADPRSFRKEYLKEVSRIDQSHELHLGNLAGQSLYEKPERLVRFAYYHCFQMAKYLIKKYGLERVLTYLRSMRGRDPAECSSVFREVFGISEIEFEEMFLR